MGKITQKDIQSVLTGIHLTLAWKKEVKAMVEKNMETISENFTKSFLNHPVTKEIMQGNSAST